MYVSNSSLKEMLYSFSNFPIVSVTSFLAWSHRTEFCVPDFRMEIVQSCVLMPDSPRVRPPGCLGLLKFLLQPSGSALGIFHFLLFPFRHFHLLYTVRAHAELFGTLPWLLPHTNMSTLSTFHRHSLLENQGNQHWNLVKFPTDGAQQNHRKGGLVTIQMLFVKTF